MGAASATIRAEPDGGVYRCVVPAPADAGSLGALFDRLAAIERERRADGRADPLRLLLVAQGEGTMDAEARQVVYQRHQEFDERYVAVLGTSVLQEFLVNFLVQATGHKTTRYFRDEAAALAWLGEPPHDP